MIIYQKYIPKKFKFKKIQKQLYRLNGFYFSRYVFMQSPFIFCKLIKSKRILPQHFESFRRVVRRNIKKTAQLSFYSICDLPVTSKKGGVRMGKGKSNVEDWVFSSKKGCIFSSISNINYKSSFFSYKKAVKKLPVKAKIVRNKFFRYRNYLNCIE